MLLAIECARSRKQSLLISRGSSSSDPRHSPPTTSPPTTTSSNNTTRRFASCVNVDSHETHRWRSPCLSSSTTTTSSSHLPWYVSSLALEDDNLGVAARQARLRLIEKLRRQLKPELARHGKGESTGCTYGRYVGGGDLKLMQGDQARGWSGNKKLAGPTRMEPRWRAMDQDKCTICLEKFNMGEVLVNLPCAHRFHYKCLVPWLEAHAHCPCCRMRVFASSK